MCLNTGITTISRRRPPTIQPGRRRVPASRTPQHVGSRGRQELVRDVSRGSSRRPAASLSRFSLRAGRRGGSPAPPGAQPRRRTAWRSTRRHAKESPSSSSETSWPRERWQDVWSR